MQIIDNLGTYFLKFRIFTGKMAGGINKKYKGDIERITETLKASLLVQGICIRGAGVEHRIACDKSDHLSIDSGKTGNEHLSEIGFQLKAFSTIDNTPDNPAHIVTTFSIVGEDFENLFRSSDPAGTGRLGGSS